MEFHQLRYFVAVAEKRHFTKAARGLHVAQPSVSRAIRVLEEELGTSLFHRMKGNVALTPAGETLLPWARRVLADVDGATGEVRELADLRRGRLAVGATPSLTITLLPPALAKFHSAYPGIDLVLQEAGSRDLVRELEQGALDVALVILPVSHETLETSPLLREELVVAVAPDHALASRRTIPIADLKGVPLVMFRDGYDLRAATVAACPPAGFQPPFPPRGGARDGAWRPAAPGGRAGGAVGLRQEGELAGIQALLVLSNVATQGLYVGVVILLIGGITAAFMAGLWGRGWIRAAIALLVALIAFMYAGATPYYGAVRRAAGLGYYIIGKRGGGPEPVNTGDLARLLGSSRATELTAVGTIGLLLLVWLMVMKPF